MERILRGDLRFSCGGFTYLRIALRLSISAPTETSAHTGRRHSLRGLFRVPAMGFAEKLLVKSMTASSTGTKAKPGKRGAQKSGLNRSILDASPFELRRQLQYKTQWNSGSVP